MEDASLAKVQLCEYENQTLEAFVAASCLIAKFDCPVARQKFSLLATAHDCETGLHQCISCSLPDALGHCDDIATPGEIHLPLCQ